MPKAATDPPGLAGHGQALDGLLESLFSGSKGDAGLRPELPESDPCSVPRSGGSGLDDPDSSLREAETGAGSGNTVPAWAGDGFRALLFRIGEFRFALPLVLMRSVSVLPGRLNRLPGQPDWQLGLVRYRGQLVTIADLGLLVGLQTRGVTPRFLLSIGDGRGAIACDEIEDAELVESKMVRWARPGTGRAWLAGLLTEQMCGLHDGDVLSERIRHG